MGQVARNGVRLKINWGGVAVFLKSPERNPFGQAEFVEAVLERRVVLEGKP